MNNMSLTGMASEGSAWYRCMECRAVFKLKSLMLRHLKTRHQFPDRPEWELDNNDEKCSKWWERVKVEGFSVTRVEPPTRSLRNIQDSLMTPSFSLQDINTSNPSTFMTLPDEAKKFKCDLCNLDMWFAFKKSLYAHLLKNHDKGVCKIPGVSMCRFCGFRAESATHLKAHIRSHTGESEEDARLVECNAHCGRVFSSKASMKKHVRFKCAEAKRLGLDDVVKEGEEVKSPRVPKTNPHVLRQSATDLPFKCNQCVETFPTQARLHGHLGVHSGDLYRCRYCGAPFAHVHTRGAHETNAHNEELGYGYRCPVCSKNFANIATIRGHYKYTHWLDLPPREEIESWRIGVTIELVELEQPDFQSMMQNHQILETPSSSSSSSAFQHPALRMGVGIGVSQVTMGALIGHIPAGEPPPLPEPEKKKKVVRSPRKKTSPKKKKSIPKIERKKFHCRKSDCDGKFQRRWELTWHLERVHGEFTCEFCSLPPFRTKMDMVQHQYQVHHRELGCYECRLCGRSLESPRGVQEHVALEHPGSMVPLTLEAKMWRKGAINRKRVQRPSTQTSQLLQ